MRHLLFSLLMGILLLSGCAGAEKGPDGTVRDLAGSTYEGDTVRLADFQARKMPVALIFFQTWCESCKEEAPHLVEAAKQYEGRLAFLGVHPGTDVGDDEVTKTKEAWRLPYPIVRDPDLAWVNAFGIRGVPTIVILDETGRTRFTGHKVPPSLDRYARKEALPAAAAPDTTGGVCEDGVCPLPVPSE